MTAPRGTAGPGHHIVRWVDDAEQHWVAIRLNRDDSTSDNAWSIADRPTFSYSDSALMHLIGDSFYETWPWDES